MVEEAGYSAHLPTPSRRLPRKREATTCARGSWSPRSLAAGAANVDGPGAAVPRLGMDSLPLATPVVLWGGWPFHRAAWQACATRPRRWTRSSRSAYFRRGSGRWLRRRRRCRRGRHAHAVRADAVTQRRRCEQIYLEIAAVVIAFLLAGRFLEARAKRSAGAALGRSASRRQGRRGPRRGRRRAAPCPSPSCGRRPLRRPSGRTIATDGVVVEALVGRCSMLTGESLPVEVAAATRSQAPRSTWAGGWSSRRCASAPTRRSRRSRSSSRTRSGRRPCSGSPTACRPSSCPVVIAIAVATLGAGSAPAPTRRAPSPRRSPC